MSSRVSAVGELREQRDAHHVKVEEQQRQHDAKPGGLRDQNLDSRQGVRQTPKCSWRTATTPILCKFEYELAKKKGRYDSLHAITEERPETRLKERNKKGRT